MTNFEKIKEMSVEEIAEQIINATNLSDCNMCPAATVCENCRDKSCLEILKEWLESEAEENMLPELCSCGYRFEADETICPNCGKKVEEDG